MHLCNCFVVKWSGVQEGSVHVKNDMGDLGCRFPSAPVNMLAENRHPPPVVDLCFWNLDFPTQITEKYCTAMNPPPRLSLNCSGQQSLSH